MMFFQEQRITNMEFYFAIKSDCRVINEFQQEYPGETAPHASTIILLVQRLRNTGLVEDWKRSDRASIVKTKMADVETASQKSPWKRLSVYINIITEFMSLLKVMKSMLSVAASRQYGQYGSFN
ncbi:DUF4817 domain-containing protein [Trichonephila clavipes]|nr:DUF4817 domain-containing protein [Trichonephila clavipes]